jgi:FKBP-type peptidyl-prolyl cis-trans isomerase
MQVKVNYHGTVDGKIFDSSVDKDWLKTQKRKAEPIVFKVMISTKVSWLGNIQIF